LGDENLRVGGQESAKAAQTRQGPTWNIDESAGDQNLGRCTNVSVK
jgi:hypothetical protein